MALSIGELAGYLTLDNSKFSAGLGKSQAEFTGATNNIKAKAKAAALVVGASLAAGSVIAAKALYNIGATFDDVADNLRVQTGATGKDLDQLTSSVKRIGTEIPASFEEIGEVLAKVRQRTGATGPVLEKLTKQFVEAGRITGKAIDVDKITAAFNAFGVKGKAASDSLDVIFRISQKTGVGMNELANLLGRNAPMLKQFGFGVEDASALLGSFEKAGLDSNRTLATLSRAMVEYAKQGKKPKEALQGTIASIERFTKKGNDAAAVKLASKIFGTRGASQFVAAVKSGAVNVDALTRAAQKNGDSILKTAADTEDFAEKWERFKNKVLVKLEPLAAKVFDAMGDGMDYIDDHSDQIMGFFNDFYDVVKNVVKFLVDNKASVGAFIAVLGGFKILTSIASGLKAARAAMIAFNIAMAANPIGLIITALALLAAGLVYAYQHSETFRDIVNAVFKAVGTAAKFMWDKVIKPVFKFWINTWLTVVGAMLDGAAKAFGWMPKIGPKLKGIAKDFHHLKDDVNAQLDGIKTPKKVKVTADTSDATRKVKGLTGFLDRAFAHAWTAAVVAHASAAGVGAGHNARGTPSWRGGPTWVGEEGPELLDVPAGARIYSHRQSLDMLQGKRPVEINVYDKSGSPRITASETARRFAHAGVG